MMRQQRGFSLVELMVAMTVTLIVSGAIYGLLTSGSSAFRREPEVADRQQNIRQTVLDGVRKGQISSADTTDYDKFVVLDDIIDKEFQYADTLVDLFAMGRHSYLSVFLATQYPKAVPPKARGNAKFVVIFANSVRTQMECLWQDYMSEIHDRREAYSMLKKYATDKQVLIIDNRPGVDVKYYVHQADEPDHFELGSLKYWGDERAYPRLDENKSKKKDSAPKANQHGSNSAADADGRGGQLHGRVPGSYRG